MKQKVTIPEGYIFVTECCPNCGQEIDLMIREGEEKIPFCPYCGEKDVLLCSECMEELGDCEPSAHCAYCHGHPNTNQ